MVSSHRLDYQFEALDADDTRLPAGLQVAG